MKTITPPADSTLLSVRMPTRLVTSLRELAAKENNRLSPYVRRELSRVVARELAGQEATDRG